VAADDFGEGVFGILSGVLPQQINVGNCHFQEYIAADGPNPTQKRGGGS
jgi:hypothetical protein